MQWLCSAVIVIAMAGGANASPGLDAGIVYQSVWTDNEYLDNAYSWGFFISKTLSAKVTVSGWYSQVQASQREIGTLSYGFLVPYSEADIEWVQDNSKGQLYEVMIHHALAEGSKMRLDAGLGLMAARFELHRKGETTQQTVNVSQYPTGLRLSLQVSVKQLIRSPFGLRLGYDYRIMSTAGYVTDALQPFTELTMSSVFATVTARW